MNTRYTSEINETSFGWFKVKRWVWLLNLYQILTCAICCSYGTVSNSKTIKNSRLVSQKDDVHVCIMCLRAIMNYQVPNSDTTAHHFEENSIVEANTQSDIDMCHKLEDYVFPVQSNAHYIPRFFSDHILFSLSLSSSCSMASIWSCLTHTQSMKLLSAWTIRTHGKNRGPPSP